MRLLDLFCGEGGAAAGYIQAGWEVVGVDSRKSCRKHYPGTFIHGDALEYLRDNGHSFDAIHASPPCQRYSAGTRATNRDKHPDLVGATRDLLTKLGRPWVIENVVGAPLVDPILLCGRMFGLTAIDDDGTPLVLDRHRLFESNVTLEAPEHPTHGDEQVGGSYGGARRDKDEARHVRRGGYVPSKRVQQELLGIDWMTQQGLFLSIPPAYTNHLGQQLRLKVRLPLVTA